MKNSEIMVCFFITLLLVACQTLKSMPITSTQNPLPTRSNPSSTLSPASPSSPSATFPSPRITPKITATPIVATIRTDNDLESLIEKIYPSSCIGLNFAKASQSDMPHASKLDFIEIVNVQPTPYWVSEIAYNPDGSRKAWVACDNPNGCMERLYVQDVKSKKIYEINWEWQFADTYDVIWINSDMLVFINRNIIMAINFEQRKVVYEAVIFPYYYCATTTPTPFTDN